MGYTEEKMRSIRYKMSLYDEFMEEYDYRVKNHCKEIMQFCFEKRLKSMKIKYDNKDEINFVF